MSKRFFPSLPALAFLCGALGLPLAAQALKPVDSTKSLIALIAQKADELLQKQGKGSLMIMPFKDEAGQEASGDFIAGAVATEIANRISGKKGFQVVSRQHMDELLAELSFQMSDLSDPASRKSLGKMAGADLILVGSIASVNEILKFNVQLLAVDSGSLKGGFIVDFTPDEEYRRLARPLKAESEVVVVKELPAPAEGLATRAEILETFDGEFGILAFTGGANGWGGRAGSQEAEAAAKPGLGRDKSTALELSLAARVDALPDGRSWSDSDMIWWTEAEFPPALMQDGKAADGLAFSLMAQGIRFVALRLTQDGGAGEGIESYIRLSLGEGAWTDFKIPFSAFGFPLFDPARPFRLSFNSYYLENHFLGAFPKAGTISGSLAIDDIGYYAGKYPDDAARAKEAARVASFADGIERAPFWVIFDGNTYWQPYTKDWTEEGPPRRVPGIGAQTYSQSVMKEGERSFKRISLDIAVNKDFERLLAERPDDYQFRIEIRATGVKPAKDFSQVEISARSPSFKEMYASIALRKGETESYYSAPLVLTQAPTKKKIPFSQFKDGEGNPMLPALKDADMGGLSISGAIRAQDLKRLIKSGLLSIAIDIFDISYIK
jgi:TolB-like protein